MTDETLNAIALLCGVVIGSVLPIAITEAWDAFREAIARAEREARYRRAQLPPEQQAERDADAQFWRRMYGPGE